MLYSTPSKATLGRDSTPAFSSIGLGCVTFGREIDEAVSHSIMDYTWERGITHFDTAAAYADGRSEHIVGLWLKSHRSMGALPMVATKLYPPYTAKSICTGTAASAQRLGLVPIDLLYLHTWDESAISREAATALDELVRQGHVGALGASNFTAPQLAAILELQIKHDLTPIRFLQNNHNLAIRTVDETLIGICTRHGVRIVTYSPLGGGFLTGKHLRGPLEGSRFAVAPNHQDLYFQPVAQHRLARLLYVSQRTGLTPTHLALAWALHQPGISCVLVGCRSPSHIDQALAAMAFDEPELFTKLEYD